MTAKTRILVAEDDRVIAEDIKRCLRGFGYSVSTIVSSGEQALKQLETVRPDLVLMDIVLQGRVNGIEAADRIQTSFNIPVVYLTAFSDKETLEQAKRTQPFGYIIKPFKENELHSAIEMALFKHRMEDQLRESEKLYRTLFENAPDAIFLAEVKTGKIVDANPQASRLLGRPRQEIIGLHQSELHPPEVAGYAKKMFKAHIRQCRKRDKATPSEITVLRTDGTRIEVELLAQIVRIHGEIVLQGVFRDITKRKKAEEALREKEESLRAILESTGDGILVVDNQGRVTNFNKKFTQLWRISKKLMQMRDDARLLENVLDQLSAPEQFLSKVKDLYKTSREDFDILYFKDGRIYERTSFPLMKDGEIAGRVWGFRDATERKRAQDALAAEKERLAVTLRSIGDGVIATDGEGKIVLINKVAEELTGWARNEAAGRPLAEVLHVVSEQTRLRCENFLQNALKLGNGVVPARSMILISRDGSERLIEECSAPIYDNQEDMIGVVLVLRDITLKRKMEVELQKMQKLESIGLLAGGIAHDFNNILTAVLGNVSLARMYDKLKKKDEKLEQVERIAMQAQALTQQMLTFSKGGEPILRIVSIKELLKESANFSLRGSNVRCEFSIADEIWPVKVDPGQMKQVINNLVINADQAMPSGGKLRISADNIHLKKDRSLPLEPGPYVKISIEDQGIGISPKNLPRIFDPYFTTKKKGSGLGLTTAYSIIKKQNGHMTVESRVDEGTIFSLYVPALPDEIIPRKEGEKAPIKGSGRILVMDDEEMVRDFVRDTLVSLGYEVTLSADGAEAVKLFGEAKKNGRLFDAAILDLTVPGGMGGRETIRKMKKIDPGIKAIVSSGYANDPIMANFKKYGFKGVIPKPYRVRELGELLHRVLAQKK